MKLRLETGFQPLVPRMAGMRAGSQWWVVRSSRFVSAGITVLIRPGTEQFLVPHWGEFLYLCHHGGTTHSSLFSPARMLWSRYGTAPTGKYVDILRHAVYFEVANKVTAFNPAEPHGVFMMDPHFMPKKKTGIGTYDRWVKQFRMTEEEAIGCAAHVAGLVCESMAENERSRRGQVLR